nr:MAG: protein m25.2 [Herpesviridae sp.]
MSTEWRACLRTRLSAVFQYLCRGNVIDYLQRFRGQKILLPFPVERMYSLIICARCDIHAFELDIERLIKRFCCPDVLEVIGVLDVEGVSDNGDRQIFFMGREGAIYLYNPVPDDGLYRLSEDLEGFVARGLKRFDSIYEDPQMPLIVRPPDCPLIYLKSQKDLLRYGVDAVNMTYKMSWPEGYTITFGVPDPCADASELLSEAQMEFVIFRELLVFGHFGPEDAAPEDRHALYVSGDGEVYGFRRDKCRLLKLSVSFPVFLRMGPVKFFVNYRVSGDLVDNSLYLVPRCVSGTCCLRL